MSWDQGQENLHLEPNTHTLPWLAQTQHVGDPRVLPLEMMPLSMPRRPSLGDPPPTAKHATLGTTVLALGGHTAPGSKGFPAQRWAN